MERNLVRTGEVEGTGGGAVSARLLDGTFDKIVGIMRTTAIFGDPIAAGDVTIVPVARARFGFGVGVGESGEPEIGGGGGGGGGMEMRPLGFIEISSCGVRYHPIRDPWTDVVVPVVAIVTGLSAPSLIRAGVRLYKARRR